MNLRDKLVSRSSLTIALVHVVMFVVVLLGFASITLALETSFMNALALTESVSGIARVFPDGRSTTSLTCGPDAWRISEVRRERCLPSRIDSFIQQRFRAPD